MEFSDWPACPEKWRISRTKVTFCDDLSGKTDISPDDYEPHWTKKEKAMLTFSFGVPSGILGLTCKTLCLRLNNEEVSL